MLSSPNILHVSPASSPCSSVDAIELSLWQSQKGQGGPEPSENPSAPEAMVFPLPKEIFQLPKSMLSGGQQQQVHQEPGRDEFGMEAALHELPEPIVIPSNSALFDPDEDVKMVPVILQERQWWKPRHLTSVFDTIPEAKRKPSMYYYQNEQ